LPWVSCDARALFSDFPPPHSLDTFSPRGLLPAACKATLPDRKSKAHNPAFLIRKHQKQPGSFNIAPSSNWKNIGRATRYSYLSLFPNNAIVMNPCELGSRTHALRANFSNFKSANAAACKTHAVEVKHLLQRPPTSPSSSAKDVSSARIIQPRTKSLASWVSNNTSASPQQQDALPMRKLSLGRYFKDDKDYDEDFMLVVPQEVQGSLSVTSRQAAREVPRPSVASLASCDGVTCSSDGTTSSSTGSRVSLPRRENPLRNPFSMVHQQVPFERRSGGDPIMFQGTVLSTPSTTRAAPTFLSPPPIWHEDSVPMDSQDLPEKVLLPSM